MMSYRAFRIFLVVTVFCASFLFIFGCQKKEAKQTAAPQVIPVRVMKIKAIDLKRKLEYVGNIKAQDEAVVYPKVSGKIIEKIKLEGMPVNKGDAIVSIDRDEVGLTYEKAPVESPLSGFVGRLYVDIGVHVSPQTPIALVLNMGMVKIDVDIPEKYLPSVYVGQDALVTVDAYPQEQLKGTVARVSPLVNTENRAAPIEISLSNEGYRLKSGMFARVTLVIEQHQGVCAVLQEAIMGKEPDSYVFVVEDNKAVLKKVALGLREGALYEVTDGVKEGDLVVVMGQQRLYDSAPVKVDLYNGE
jgi:multidrug efflux pump subunit AcrA (membrane-fusion protein)